MCPTPKVSHQGTTSVVAVADVSAKIIIAFEGSISSSTRNHVFLHESGYKKASRCAYALSRSCRENLNQILNNIMFPCLTYFGMFLTSNLPPLNQGERENFTSKMSSGTRQREGSLLVVSSKSTTSSYSDTYCIRLILQCIMYSIMSMP